MTTISANVVCDSVNENGVRLVTLELVYPRFIHAEVMTHRVFSRNAASSRAIPVKKLLRAIMRNPAKPLAWLRNKKGMQGGKEITGFKKHVADAIWWIHRQHSKSAAAILLWCGVHKQYANRLLEVHSHIKVLLSSTDWENFFALRDHPDAQPEFQLLAQKIRIALQGSRPNLLHVGYWHLPYIQPEDIDLVRERIAEDEQNMDIDTAALSMLQNISIARCARVSYTTFDDPERNVDADAALGEKLVSSTPLHASPMEHQATPMHKDVKRKSGNFRGWIQLRQVVPNQCIPDGTYYTHPRQPASIELVASGKEANLADDQRATQLRVANKRARPTSTGIRSRFST